MSVLDSQTISIPCADCGAKHQKSVRWLKAHNKFICTCGTIINLDHNDFLRKLRDVECSLDSLPRKITIKL